MTTHYLAAGTTAALYADARPRGVCGVVHPKSTTLVPAVVSCKNCLRVLPSMGVPVPAVVEKARSSSQRPPGRPRGRRVDAQAVRRRLWALKLTQTQLGQRLGVGSSMVTNVLKGRRGLGTESATRWAAALEVGVDELLLPE